MSHEAKRSRGRRVLALLLVVGAGLVAFAIAWPYLNSDQVATEAPVQAAKSSLPPFTRPDPVDTRYVGSAACAQCHAEISQKYQNSPKAHSLTAIAADDGLESMDSAIHTPPGSRKYVVERVDGQMIHHEIMSDDQGPIYDYAEPVSFRVGSGQALRTFLVNRAGLLFQSPIAYYIDSQTWKLAPGYHPSAHERFTHRVGDECLHCHAGQVVSVKPNSNRYERQVFKESSIGCERCHGPGYSHVAKQTAARTSDGYDDSIVNPSRLDPVLRESVCNQCHVHGELTIPRYGNGFWDFRPGQRLDDSLVVFTSCKLGDPTDPAARGPVEQMRVSRCFTASGGKLGCASCHDPHGFVPPAERAEYYRTKCMQCHNEQSCRAPESERNASPANGSCVHCHMPPTGGTSIHVARTDHRLLKSPIAFADTPPVINPEEWSFFDGADHYLPLRETARSRGLALMARAGRRGREFAARAEFHLVDGNPKTIKLERLLPAIDDDMRLFENLGRMYMVQERPNEALATWNFGLERDPESEPILENLGMTSHPNEDIEESAHLLETLFTLNPSLPRHLVRYAALQMAMGNPERAVEFIERAVKLDPSHLSSRRGLQQIYSESKRDDLAEAQKAIIERLEKVGSR